METVDLKALTKFRVGQYEDEDAMTGVTVIVAPEGAVPGFRRGEELDAASGEDPHRDGLEVGRRGAVCRDDAHERQLQGRAVPGGRRGAPFRRELRHGAPRLRQGLQPACYRSACG